MNKKKIDKFSLMNIQMNKIQQQQQTFVTIT